MVNSIKTHSEKPQPSTPSARPTLPVAVERTILEHLVSGGGVMHVALAAQAANMREAYHSIPVDHLRLIHDMERGARPTDDGQHHAFEPAQHFARAMDHKALAFRRNHTCPTSLDPILSDHSHPDYWPALKHLIHLSETADSPQTAITYLAELDHKPTIALRALHTIILHGQRPHQNSAIEGLSNAPITQPAVAEAIADWARDVEDHEHCERLLLILANHAHVDLEITLDGLDDVIYSDRPTPTREEAVSLMADVIQQFPDELPALIEVIEADIPQSVRSHAVHKLAAFANSSRLALLTLMQTVGDDSVAVASFAIRGLKGVTHNNPLIGRVTQLMHAMTHSGNPHSLRHMAHNVLHHLKSPSFKGSNPK